MMNAATEYTAAPIIGPIQCKLAEAVHPKMKIPIGIKIAPTNIGKMKTSGYIVSSLKSGKVNF